MTKLNIVSKELIIQPIRGRVQPDDLAADLTGHSKVEKGPYLPHMVLLQSRCINLSSKLNPSLLPHITCIYMVDT